MSNRAWCIWGIAALFVLFQFLLQSSTSVMIPCLMKAFHINIEQVGLLSSSFFYTYLILQIPAGILIDKIGPRILLTICLFITAIACYLFGTAQTLQMAQASRMLMGIVTAPAVVAALYLAAKWFPIKKFALIAGMTEALGMLGGALGEEFLAQCVGHLGWRNTMMACTVVAVILAILAFSFIRNCPEKPLEDLEGCIDKKPFHHCVHIIIKKSQIWYASIYAGMLFSIIAAFASLWSVPYLQARYGITLPTAAAASAMIFLGTAAGGPFWGAMVERIGKYKPIMLAGSLLSLGILSLILYTPAKLIHLDTQFFLLFLLGFGSGVYVVSFAIVRDLTSHAVRGTAMGLTNMMCIVFGAPILQFFIGYILKQTPKIQLINYQWALSTLIGYLLISLALILLVKEPHSSISQTSR